MNKISKVWITIIALIVISVLIFKIYIKTEKTTNKNTTDDTQSSSVTLKVNHIPTATDTPALLISNLNNGYKRVTSVDKQITLEIPMEWTVETIPNLTFYSLGKDNTTSIKGSSISIFTNLSSFNKPLSEYYSNENTDYIVSNKENMTINGFQALRYSVKSPGRADGTGVGALVLKNNVLYRFEVTYDKPEKEKTLAVFDHLLRSIYFSK